MRAETLELKAQLKKLKTPRQKQSKCRCRSMEEIEADLYAEAQELEAQRAEILAWEQQLRHQQMMQHQQQALKQQRPTNHLHRTAVGAPETTDA